MNNKYRGKHIETGEWIHGYLIGDAAIVGDIVEWHDEYFNTEYWYKVDQATVGQYIGINDGSNNNEWYVGDILSPNPHLQNTEVQVICYDTHQAKFKGVPLSAYLINGGHGGWTGFDIKHWQRRLGNIHDNPELLEVQ